MSLNPNKNTTGVAVQYILNKLNADFGIDYLKSGIYKPERESSTLATVINIGDSVSYIKAVKALQLTDGLATTVSNQEIMDTKVIIDSSGIGYEPALAATLVAIKSLSNEGTILKSEKIITILNGNLLKNSNIILNYQLNSIKEY